VRRTRRRSRLCSERSIAEPSCRTSALTVAAKLREIDDIVKLPNHLRAGSAGDDPQPGRDKIANRPDGRPRALPARGPGRAPRLERRKAWLIGLPSSLSQSGRGSAGACTARSEAAEKRQRRTSSSRAILKSAIRRSGVWSTPKSSDHHLGSRGRFLRPMTSFSAWWDTPEDLTAGRLQPDNDDAAGMAGSRRRVPWQSSGGSGLPNPLRRSTCGKTAARAGTDRRGRCSRRVQVRVSALSSI